MVIYIFRIVLFQKKVFFIHQISAAEFRIAQAFAQAQYSIAHFKLLIVKYRVISA